MRKTKIVCTLGPASSERDTLEKMIRAGMNVARLNLSHGTHEEHAARIRLIREISAALNLPVGILVDLQGPKIRIGKLREEPIRLQQGERVWLTPDPAAGERPRYIPVHYPTLIRDVQVGNRIYLADGMIQLQVTEIGAEVLECVVLAGGELTSRKGVTLPGVRVNLPALTDKDRLDLEFAVKEQVDFVALSFARKAEHIVETKEVINRLGGHQFVIAKIENDEGIKNSAGILQICDGIMVARGDLGIEMPLEEVPLIQKQLIEACNHVGRPVITATEMLESMVKNPRPTRAEITDIANAIFDGTDAVMLSAETAAGHNPVAAVEIMDRVAQKSESALKYEEILAKKRFDCCPTVADAISHATCQTAMDLHAAAIICSTQSGSTARMVSKYRPQAPIYATTPSDDVARQLTISWGIYPYVTPVACNTDHLLDINLAMIKELDLVCSGDTVVITAGVRTGVPGTTNLLKVHQVG